MSSYISWEEQYLSLSVKDRIEMANNKIDDNRYEKTFNEIMRNYSQDSFPNEFLYYHFTHLIKKLITRNNNKMPNQYIINYYELLCKDLEYFNMMYLSYFLHNEDCIILNDDIKEIHRATKNYELVLFCRQRDKIHNEIMSYNPPSSFPYQSGYDWFKKLTFDLIVRLLYKKTNGIPDRNIIHYYGLLCRDGDYFNGKYNEYCSKYPYIILNDDVDKISAEINNYNYNKHGKIYGLAAANDYKFGNISKENSLDVDNRIKNNINLIEQVINEKSRPNVTNIDNSTHITNIDNSNNSVNNSNNKYHNENKVDGRIDVGGGCIVM